jgi:hypothetical protein
MTTDIKELRRLLAEASPGPWDTNTSGEEEFDDLFDHIRIDGLAWQLGTEEDARLIAAAVNALPELLDEVERLRGAKARRLAGEKPSTAQMNRYELKQAQARIDRALELLGPYLDEYEAVMAAPEEWRPVTNVYGEPYGQEAVPKSYSLPGIDQLKAIRAALTGEIE